MPDDAATAPYVIHVNEMADHPDAIYIGRAMPRRRLRRHPLANQFTVRDHGRDGAIAMYRDWLYRYIGSDTHEEGEILHMIRNMAGRPLACWCRRSDEPATDQNRCHGDILVGLWREEFGTKEDTDGL